MRLSSPPEININLSEIELLTWSITVFVRVVQYSGLKWVELLSLSRIELGIVESDVRLLE